MDPLSALAGGSIVVAGLLAGTRGPEHHERIVVASRVAESEERVAASVSAIGREALERQLARDVRDALRYEPGVSVDASPARFGLGNLNIRGLDGNRVQMLVDGVRLPDAYRVGSFSNASRHAFELGWVSRLELLRGPASAQYGSDALAGVLAVTTIDPADLLGDARALGGFAGAAYDRVDRGLTRAAAAAARAGPLQLMLAASRGDGHERGNRGTDDSTGATRTAPNPQDTRGESVLAKAVAPLAGGGRLRATFDLFERRVATDVRSLNPQSPRTESLAGDDVARRARYSLDGVSYALGPLDELTWLLYSQSSETTQDTAEVRANTTAACLSAAGAIRCRREARFDLRQRERGLSVVARRGVGDHDLVAGVDLARLRAEELRDGRQVNLATGDTTSVVGTDVFPTRDFPTSASDRAGAFLQDTWAWRGATIVPALRYDRYRMRPEADALYASANPTRPAVGGSDAAWSPKLGLVLPVGRHERVTLQAASGFRAPPAADVNVGLSNLPLGYTVIPNAQLRPERSRGLEMGLRGDRDGLGYSITAYRTGYRDLIVSRAPLACPADPRCVAGAPITFQSQNVGRARIEGVEARLAWRFAPGWTVKAGAAASRGDDRNKGVPLNSIDPPRAVAGLEWRSGGHGAQVHATHAWRKSRIDLTAGVLEPSDASTTLDAMAHVALGRRVTLHAGLFNATNRKYALWSDLRGALNPGLALDRYTQPGRTYAVGLRIEL